MYSVATTLRLHFVAQVTDVPKSKFTLTLKSAHRALRSLLSKVVENALGEVKHCTVTMTNPHAAVGVRSHPFAVRAHSAKDRKARQAVYDHGAVEPKCTVLTSEKLRV